MGIAENIEGLIGPREHPPQVPERDVAKLQHAIRLVAEYVDELKARVEQLEKR